MYYNEFDMNTFVNKNKKNIRLIIIINVVTILICVGLCFLCKYELYKPFEAIMIGLSFISLSTSFFILDEFILNNKKMINHYKMMLNCNPVLYTGEIVGFDDTSTVEKRISAKIVKVKIRTLEHSFYLLNSFDFPFKEGDKINVFSANRYIVKVEKANE